MILNKQAFAGGSLLLAISFMLLGCSQHANYEIKGDYLLDQNTGKLALITRDSVVDLPSIVLTTPEQPKINSFFLQQTYGPTDGFKTTVKTIWKRGIIRYQVRVAPEPIAKDYGKQSKAFISDINRRRTLYNVVIEFRDKDSFRVAAVPFPELKKEFTLPLMASPTKNEQTSPKVQSKSSRPLEIEVYLAEGESEMTYDIYKELTSYGINWGSP